MIDEKITIPKPCHENWDKMTPKDNGRHCDSCNHVVVDFTEMSDEEVLIYLKNKNDVCGHFNKSQIASKRPLIDRYLLAAREHTSRKLSSHILRNSILALLGLFMILSGCRRRTTGHLDGKIRMPNKEIKKRMKDE